MSNEVRSLDVAASDPWCQMLTNRDLEILLGEDSRNFRQKKYRELRIKTPLVGSLARYPKLWVLRWLASIPAGVPDHVIGANLGFHGLWVEGNKSPIVAMDYPLEVQEGLAGKLVGPLDMATSLGVSTAIIRRALGDGVLGDWLSKNPDGSRGWMWEDFSEATCITVPLYWSLTFALALEKAKGIWGEKKEEPKPRLNWATGLDLAKKLGDADLSGGIIPGPSRVSGIADKIRKGEIVLPFPSPIYGSYDPEELSRQKQLQELVRLEVEKQLPDLVIAEVYRVMSKTRVTAKAQPPEIQLNFQIDLDLSPPPEPDIDDIPF